MRVLHRESYVCDVLRLLFPEETVLRIASVLQAILIIGSAIVLIYTLYFIFND